MKSKLPKKYENNFFIRIKIFLSKIFSKEMHKQRLGKDTVIKKQEKITYKYENAFLNQMREESKKAKLKKSILTMIDDNPQMIKKLSVVRLKQLISMYDKEIEEKELKIVHLKRKLGKGEK